MKKESSKLSFFILSLFPLKTFLTRLKYILIRRIAILECDSYCRNETVFAHGNDTISHILYLKERSLACFIERWIEQAPELTAHTKRDVSHVCARHDIFVCSYLYVYAHAECICNFEFYLSEYPVLPCATTSFGRKETDVVRVI